jgi:hypothetical protein
MPEQFHGETYRCESGSGRQSPAEAFYLSKRRGISLRFALLEHSKDPGLSDVAKLRGLATRPARPRCKLTQTLTHLA